MLDSGHGATSTASLWLSGKGAARSTGIVGLISEIELYSMKLLETDKVFPLIGICFQSFFKACHREASQ